MTYQPFMCVFAIRSFLSLVQRSTCASPSMRAQKIVYCAPLGGTGESVAPAADADNGAKVLLETGGERIVARSFGGDCCGGAFSVHENEVTPSPRLIIMTTAKRLIG